MVLRISAGSRKKGGQRTEASNVSIEAKTGERYGREVIFGGLLVKYPHATMTVHT